MLSFDVETGWISESGQEALLIKTLTMQPELPCRNEAFEESLNAPFRVGCPQITAHITMTDSRASLRKNGIFLPPRDRFSLSYFLGSLVAFWA